MRASTSERRGSFSRNFSGNSSRTGDRVVRRVGSNSKDQWKDIHNNIMEVRKVGNQSQEQWCPISEEGINVTLQWQSYTTDLPNPVTSELGFALGNEFAVDNDGGIVEVGKECLSFDVAEAEKNTDIFDDRVLRKNFTLKHTPTNQTHNTHGTHGTEATEVTEQTDQTEQTDYTKSTDTDDYFEGTDESDYETIFSDLETDEEFDDDVDDTDYEPSEATAVTGNMGYTGKMDEYTKRKAVRMITPDKQDIKNQQRRYRAREDDDDDSENDLIDKRGSPRHNTSSRGGPRQSSPKDSSRSHHRSSSRSKPRSRRPIHTSSPRRSSSVNNRSASNNSSQYSQDSTNGSPRKSKNYDHHRQSSSYSRQDSRQSRQTSSLPYDPQNPPKFILCGLILDDEIKGSLQDANATLRQIIRTVQSFGPEEEHAVRETLQEAKETVSVKQKEVVSGVREKIKRSWDKNGGAGVGERWKSFVQKSKRHGRCGGHGMNIHNDEDDDDDIIGAGTPIDKFKCGEVGRHYTKRYDDLKELSHELEKVGNETKKKVITQVVTQVAEVKKEVKDVGKSISCKSDTLPRGDMRRGSISC